METTPNPKIPTYELVLPEYRLLSVKAVGDSGTKVRITYYDTKNFQFFEKFDDWEHITVSREIVPIKHGFTPESMLIALKGKYPTYKFSTHSYGHPSFGDAQTYGDREVFTQGTESFIVWHHGAREERNNLEFFLDEEKKKQIFFRNSPKRFLTRTRLINPSQTGACISHFKSIGGLESILDEDILVKSNRQGDKAYVQVKCMEYQLYLLPEAYFRVLTYTSDWFSTEKKAQEIFEKVRFLDGSKTYISQLKIVEYIDEDRIKNYYVKAVCDANKGFTERLMDIGMHKKMKIEYNGKEKHVRSAQQELWDPLLLNNFTQQLRDFFPIHMAYNPDKSLSSQANTLVYPFVIKGVSLTKHQNHFDSAVRDATKFYMNNTCAIDLEVIDYTKGSQEISGRVYMAVLNSFNENKLYITKEVWHNDYFRSSLLKNYADNGSNVEFVFAEDELDLIAKLSSDSSKYYNIIGHNFKDFDHEHLIKFNYEHKLFKKGLIDMEMKERIKNLRKSLGKERLWNHTTDQVLDTYQYVKHRVDLFADHKLSTFAGFKKSINYDEMNNLVKSENLDALEIVIAYTLEDGDKSWALNKQLLENGILESLATNKSLSSVFSSDPIKNFYNAGKRTYFMRLHTFRDRHSMSPRRHLEKLNSRLHNYEIFQELVSDIPQRFGQINGELYYPSLFVESFKDILFMNPAMQYIYIKMRGEQNPLVKADLLWKLSAALIVPVDKMKNYIESSGNRFGEHVTPSQVYNSLSVDSDDIETIAHTYYGTNDFELSRTSYIFRVEYSAHGNSEKIGELPIDTTIINYNNRFVDRLNKFRQAGFIGRSKKYIISDKHYEDRGDSPDNNFLGYSLGEVRVINLDGERFIGKLSDKDLYQSIRKPKHPVITSLVQDWLNDEPIDRNSAIQSILKMPYDDQINDTNRQISKALLEFDPLKSKGNLQLF